MAPRALQRADTVLRDADGDHDRTRCLGGIRVAAGGARFASCIGHGDIALGKSDARRVRLPVQEVSRAGGPWARNFRPR